VAILNRKKLTHFIDFMSEIHMDQKLCVSCHKRYENTTHMATYNCHCHMHLECMMNIKDRVHCICEQPAGICGYVVKIYYGPVLEFNLHQSDEEWQRIIREYAQKDSNVNAGQSISAHGNYSEEMEIDENNNMLDITTNNHNQNLEKYNEGKEQPEKVITSDPSQKDHTNNLDNITEIIPNENQLEDIDEYIEKSGDHNDLNSVFDQKKYEQLEEELMMGLVDDCCLLSGFDDNFI